MHKSNSYISIDTDYFRKIVTNSGLTQEEFAKTVGRTKSFIWNSTHNRKMLRNTAELLCKMHGADLDKLIVKDEPKDQSVHYTDAQSIDTLVKAIINIDKKLDMLIRELH